MKKLTTKTKVAISVLHGLLLLFALWYVNGVSSYFSIGDEALLKKIFIIEDLLLPRKFRPPHDFVFVNVSRDLSLIENPEEYGNISITDRSKLSAFFRLLADNANRHQFVLCDVFFEYPSADDSLLAVQAGRCKNLLFPFHYKDNELLQPCISVPVALADFQTYEGEFSKFRLIYHDSVQTIPWVLYKKFARTPPAAGIALNTMAPRYYIRPSQFQSHIYPCFNLGELLSMSADRSFYHDYIQNKFIVIGDFESQIDEHETPAGNMYGPLILLNTYLSLLNGRFIMSWGLILFLAACLTATSYLLFFVPLKPPEPAISPWVNFIVHHILNRVFSFLAICTFIVLAAEMIFSVQLFISPVFLYLVYVNWAIQYYNKHFLKKQE